jgi:YD repeat-containing protein
MFEHRSSPSEWQGARLGWVGAGWALKRLDGTIMRFQSCTGSGRPCSIVEERDGDGHSIHYRRDRSGRLLRMEAQDRWIAFTYDTDKRIVRAYDSAGNDVRYGYDADGRLAHVQASNGNEHRYTYTDRDEMSTISDPGIRIENAYGPDGRCVRQVSYTPGSQDPYRFEFAYLVKDGVVMQSDVTQSDGTWTRYTYGPDRYIESESRADAGSQPLTFTYTRNPLTSVVTTLTLTCPDETGRLVQRSSPVGNGNEEWVKWGLLVTTCSGSNQEADLPKTWPQAAGA